MTTEQILEMLMVKEDALYQALVNAKLVFGEDSEAAKLARARWNTTYEILKTIQNA